MVAKMTRTTLHIMKLGEIDQHNIYKHILHMYTVVREPFRDNEAKNGYIEWPYKTHHAILICAYSCPRLNIKF
jgi:hypothetical protein